MSITIEFTASLSCSCETELGKKGIIKCERKTSDQIHLKLTILNPCVILSTHYQWQELSPWCIRTLALFFLNPVITSPKANVLRG